ncbi:ECF-type sigma factor [Ideonella sp. DXS29W]|uniref:ECF-type sigma factor n=1 Tax=Ideonella lacteola TaxID=2984193 RepID=A0ABU9BZZ8_9BURK
MSDLQALIDQARGGSASARQQLFDMLYRDLKQLARSRLHVHSDGAMSATTLVHETYLKLVQSAAVRAGSRGEFFALAGHVMRSIIIDDARARLAAKRGGGVEIESIDSTQFEWPELADEAMDDERLLALNDALDRLGEADERMMRVVELKFFAGLTIEEAAEALDLSPRTVKRAWQGARAFLRGALAEAGLDPAADA